MSHLRSRAQWRSLSGLAAATALLTIASTAFADDPAASDTVVVSAARGTKLDNMDVSTTVMNRQQVEQAPEETIDQILNRITSVDTPMVPSDEQHPTGKRITMRGFGGGGAERTLVMVDGIPINDPFFRYVNWDKIPKETIDHIEVIRGGGATSLWGNMAMGGVINIVTREPQAGETRVSAGFGSNATFRSDASTTLFSNDKVKVGVDIARSQTQGYSLIPAPYSNVLITPARSYSNDVTLSNYFTPSDWSKFWVKLGAHQIEEGGYQYDKAKNDQQSLELSVGGTVDLAPGQRLDLVSWLKRYEMKTDNVSIGVHGSTSAGYSWQNPQNPNYFTYYSGVDHNPYYDYGGSAIYKVDLAEPFRDVMAGVDVRNIWGKDANQSYKLATSTATGYTLSEVPQYAAHSQQQFEGLFAQGTWMADSLPFETTLGLRQDFWRAFGYQFGQEPEHSYGLYTHFDPRLGVKYYITSEFALRGAVYENFNAPGMNQMFRPYGTTSSYSLANPNLSPETNFGREAGFEYKTSRVDLFSNVFQNDLTNLIDKATVCNSPTSCSSWGIPFTMATGGSATKYFNAGDAVIEGWEVGGDWKVTPEITLRSGITRNIAWLQDNDRAVFLLGYKSATAYYPLHGQLGQVPGLIGNAGISWTPIRDLVLDAQLRSWNQYWDDTQHTTRDQAATVVDLGAQYKLTENLQVFSSVNNAFDNHFFTSGLKTGSTGSTPTLGQPLTVFGGIRATF